MSKIVIIGAGSASFGPAILGDLFLHANELRGSELWLVDTNAEALETMTRYAQLIMGETSQLFIFASTDRRDALPNADFVIVAVAVDRVATWKLDWQIPLKHGVRHVLGENGGPGGLSHALRNIPLLLSIARDVEALAPNALLLNFSNPMSRLCLALHRHSTVKFVGLCHQIGEGYKLVNEVLGLVGQESRIKNTDFKQRLDERYQLVAAGLNHFTFILGMIDRQTGEDLYPLFRQKVAAMPAYWELMSRRMMDAFGLFCASGDGHAGEYVGFAAETMPLTGYDFDAYEQRSQTQWANLQSLISNPQSSIPDPKLFRSPSGERAVPIICAIVHGKNQPELAVNLPNRGYIDNLPQGAVVEVPGVASGAGVQGLHVGALPRGLAALMQREIDIQELCVEAAVKGDRKAALQALLLDPNVHSYAKANYLLDDLLRAHAKYLPQFK